MYKLFSKKKFRKVLKESYNFTERNFYQLTGNTSVSFSLMANDLYEKVSPYKRIGIYGTGAVAKGLIQQFSIHGENMEGKISCIIEKNDEKVGKTFEKLPVVTLQDAITLYDTDAVIIAASKDNQEIIHNRIKHVQVEGIQIIRMFD